MVTSSNRMVDGLSYWQVLLRRAKHDVQFRLFFITQKCFAAHSDFMLCFKYLATRGLLNCSLEMVDISDVFTDTMGASYLILNDLIIYFSPTGQGIYIIDDL